MTRLPDENGQAYLRTYRGLDGVVTHEQFAQAVHAQGLPAPSQRMFDHIQKLYRDGQPHYIAINEFDQMRRNRRRAWTVQRVSALVAEGGAETERLDFKREVSESTTKKPWAAMANSGGGDVLYGIDESASAATGIEPVAFQGLDERLTQLNQHVDPPTNISVTKLPLAPTDDEGVIWVRVAPSARGTVHLVDHRAPIRDGTTTRYMTSEEMRRWVREHVRP